MEGLCDSCVTTHVGIDLLSFMSPSGRKDRGMSILAYISASGAVDL
jgi:hypothetical protein